MVGEFESVWLYIYSLFIHNPLLSFSLSLSHTHKHSSLWLGRDGLGVTFKISREGWGCWIASFRDHIKREKKTKNLNYLHWLISHSLSLSGSPSLCSSISLSISRWWSWWRWRSRWPPLTSATTGRESPSVFRNSFFLSLFWWFFFIAHKSRENINPIDTWAEFIPNRW